MAKYVILTEVKTEALDVEWWMDQTNSKISVELKDGFEAARESMRETICRLTEECNFFPADGGHLEIFDEYDYGEVEELDEIVTEILTDPKYYCESAVDLDIKDIDDEDWYSAFVGNSDLVLVDFYNKKLKFNVHNMADSEKDYYFEYTEIDDLGKIITEISVRLLNTERNDIEDFESINDGHYYRPVYYDDIQFGEIQQFIRDEWGFEEDVYVGNETHSEYVDTFVESIGGKGEKKTFVTIGVGARKMKNSPIPDYNRIELLMIGSPDMNTDFSDRYQNAHIVACAELTSLSKYPFRNDTWLGPNHTINASDRFAEEFGYQYFLFVEYPKTANITGAGYVHFLVAVPVYEEERDWMATHENGSQRFLNEYIKKFEQNGNNDNLFMIDLKREVIIPSNCEK